MNGFTLTVQTATPLLMIGADNNRSPNPSTPELRAASFRGVFRYWLRAALGRECGANYQQLHDAESVRFGSADVGSAIRLRVEALVPAPVPERHRDTVLPPYFGYDHFNEGAKFKLLFDVHPLKPAHKIFDAHFWCGLLLAVNFGAFGKRARRGGGALRVTAIAESNEGIIPPEVKTLLSAAPKTIADLKLHLKAVCAYVEQNTIAVPMPQLPGYPIFHPQHVKVYVWNRSDSNSLVALDESFWSVTGAYHHMSGAWGYANNGRRASALHVRVHWCGNAYVPMITVFHSGKADEKWVGLGEEALTLENALQTLAITGFDLIYGNPRGNWS